MYEYFIEIRDLIVDLVKQSKPIYRYVNTIAQQMSKHFVTDGDIRLYDKSIAQVYPRGMTVDDLVNYVTKLYRKYYSKDLYRFDGKLRISLGYPPTDTPGYRIVISKDNSIIFQIDHAEYMWLGITALLFNDITYKWGLKMREYRWRVKGI